MKEITESQFNESINDENLVIIDFYATWCMPCRMLKPILERIETKFADIKFYSVDVSECEEVSKQYRIFSVPTLMAFKQGKKLDSIVGLKSFDEISKFVEQCKTMDVDAD